MSRSVLVEKLRQLFGNKSKMLLENRGEFCEDALVVFPGLIRYWRTENTAAQTNCAAVQNNK